MFPHIDLFRNLACSEIKWSLRFVLHKKEDGYKLVSLGTALPLTSYVTWTSFLISVTFFTSL